MAALIHGRVENVVVFTLPSLPPSVNEIYGPTRSVHSATPRWEPKAIWKRWRGEMRRHVKVLRVTPGSSVRFDAWFFYNRYCKNGSVRRADPANLLKWLIDTVADAQDWDDCLVWQGSWGSSHDPDNPRVAVRLTEVRR